MKKIEKGIVISNDIERILSGINAYDFSYQYTPNRDVITKLRKNFEEQIKVIFNNNVTIISEKEMLNINKLIGGRYPHCYIG